MNGPRCPVCNSDHRSLFETFGKYHVYRCGHCDLVYSDPMNAMKPEEYAADYHAKNLHHGFASALENGHLEFLKRHSGMGKKLLDVGTSTGLFVNECARRGFDALGIDTDPAAVAEGKKMFPQASIELCTLEEVKKAGRRFDYVTLFEVLEHVEAPKPLLKSCLELLNPGGTLVVFVPNRRRTPYLYREMIDRGIDMPPHHLTKWSKQALRHLFEEIGIVNTYIRDIGKYRLPFLPSLGLATRVRNRIVSQATEAGASEDARVSYNHAARRLYKLMAKTKLKVDQTLFYFIDAFYRLRGYERDGLYIEGSI